LIDKDLDEKKKQQYSAVIRRWGTIKSNIHAKKAAVDRLPAGGIAAYVKAPGGTGF
jgi:hypothetical protein